MPKLHRYQSPEQIELFNPPRALPSWKMLPADVQKTVIQLLKEILLNHRTHEDISGEEGGPADE
jgi:hypothetical protein